MGPVEEIGLRSTRIRGLDRTVITVPNADFAQMQIVNFTRRDMNLFQFVADQGAGLPAHLVSRQSRRRQ